jgi:pimeloyl-ACP methyl ester carboxylesterase
MCETSVRRNLTRFAPDNIVLFVHGATGSPESGFDLKLDGLSWMEWMARQGNDVYFVSVRGYGRSTRPREMDEPPMNNPPVVRTDTAARDVGAAVDFIRSRRSVDKISLLGHSWGTTIMALYTTQNNAKVHRPRALRTGLAAHTGALTDRCGRPSRRLPHRHRRSREKAPRHWSCRPASKRN